MNTNPDIGAGTFDALVYQVRLPLSSRTLCVVADLIRTERRRIGSRWRKADPGRQALLVLAFLRHDQRYADLAGANGISASTMRRWVEEVIRLLAARAPRLDRVLARIKGAGGQFVLLDGTFIPTRRRSGPANRRNYNYKRKGHGLLFFGLTDERGNLCWISRAFRGGSSEVTDARQIKITSWLRRHELGAFTDLGFTGLEDNKSDPVILIGTRASRHHPLTAAQRQTNRLISRERAANEHGFADLKQWRALTKLRRTPTRATALLRALLVLTATEIHH